MRYLRLIFIPIVAFALTFTSCNDDDDDDWIYDVTPIGLYLTVTNATGDNLLDENVADNICGLPVSVVYKGKKYTLDTKDVNIDTRYWPTTWEGVSIKRYSDGDTFLFIGEMEGATNCYNTVTLTIGDKSYEISYDNTVQYRKQFVDFVRHYYLNGDLVYGPTDSPYGMITIIY